jgi:hypothetical protein
MRATRVLLAAVLCVWALPVLARTLEVGQGREFKLPSQAVAAAKDGDTIDIYPGQYVDCATVRQHDLTIEGKGPGVVMTDKVCGKGILDLIGSDITIRNITLQRAHVPQGNGAGIMAEGGDLTIENSRFMNNENGILSRSPKTAHIRILSSEFMGNGKCEPDCAHAIYINGGGLLHVERTRFLDTHVGHDIKSRALRTEVIACDMEDGPEGNSSYLIEAPNGGALIVEGNTMEKGPNSQNPATAIMIGAEGVTQPTDELRFRGNTFTNDQAKPTTFVHNLSKTPAQLIGNVFKGKVTPLEGPGTVK